MNTPADIFKNVLIVSANEGHARVDRDFLKGARIFQARTAASGAEALRILAKRGADLILCDASLADMAGLDFIKSLKEDAALAPIPALMVTTVNARKAVLQAVSSGCAGYLVRPYSQAAFHKHLGLALQAALFAREGQDRLDRGRADLENGRNEAAIGNFEAVTKVPDQAPRHFQEGMLHLAEKRYDPAIASFNKAVKLNALYAEAYLGLASAWQAKGNTANARKYMRQAAAACARQRNFQELKERFTAFLQNDKEFNPFYALGNEHMRQREYGQALGSFVHAVELTPRRGDVFVEMGKAYHFLRRPELALKAVSKGLRLQPDNPAGRTLYRRFTGKNYDDLQTMEEFHTSSDSLRLPLLLRGALYLAAAATDFVHRSKGGSCAA